MPEMSIDEARQQLIDAGRAMLEQGVTWGNAGNLSIRTAPDRYLITATGTRLGDLTPDDFAECRVDGSPLDTARRPSKEMPMHRAVYLERPEINVILHASPFYSTLIACSGERIPPDLFVESMYYLERVARVPYAHPGSSDLGEAVRAQAKAANVLLLENHGVLVYDVNMREAFMGLQTLEYTARMLVTARSAGIELRELPPQIAAHFRNHAGYKPRREWS
jgi:3-dehydro-4-phosphotetronate decarboxylase